MNAIARPCFKTMTKPAVCVDTTTRLGLLMFGVIYTLFDGTICDRDCIATVLIRAKQETRKVAN